MGRQHLAVRVHVEPAVLRLLEEFREVAQVMPRDEDAGPRSDAEAHGRGRRRAVGLRVRRVKERHRPDGRLAAGEDEPRERVGRQALAHCLERTEDEGVDRVVLLAEHGRVMRVGRDALQPEERDLLEAAHVGIDVREGARHRATDRMAEVTLARRDRLPQALVVEVRVRERQEQGLHDEAPTRARRLLRRRQLLQPGDQDVHERRRLGALPADADARATRVAERLLALPAEHRVLLHVDVVHGQASFPSHRHRPWRVQYS